MSQFTISERHQRSYSPLGLMVLSGPGEEYKAGSHWMVGDQNGYAEIRLMHDSKAYMKNTLYVEHLVIKEDRRRRGYGSMLFRKIEAMARNLGVDYVQLDSESDAVGFWYKMGFTALDVIYYQNKTAMIKEI